MDKLDMYVLNSEICAMETAERFGYKLDILERCTLSFLRELREYRILKEQGKLLKLPCAVGDEVYTNTSMQGWYFRKENRPYKAKVVFIGVNGGENYMNVDFGNGHMLQFKFSDIGKTVFLTQEEAVAVLQNLGVWQ